MSRGAQRAFITQQKGFSLEHLHQGWDFGAQIKSVQGSRDFSVLTKLEEVLHISCSNRLYFL